LYTDRQTNQDKGVQSHLAEEINAVVYCSISLTFSDSAAGDLGRTAS